MVDEKKHIEIELDKLYEKMAVSDLTQMAVELKNKRSDFEKTLINLNPFLKEECIKMIIDYAILLNCYHSKTPGNFTDKKEMMEHLIAATFAVAFTTANGVDVAKTLPILALSGVNIELAEKIVKDYHSALEQIQKEPNK